jgi:hypothetical protein
MLFRIMLYADICCSTFVLEALVLVDREQIDPALQTVSLSTSA